MSKLHPDVCVGTTQQRVMNDADEWSELTAILRASRVDLVLSKATGGYERGLVCALQSAGVCVARVNPRQARDFAKSMGVTAKTDQADARILKDFADVLSRHADRHKFVSPMLDQARQALAELMTRRRQLVDMRVAEHNRLEYAGPRAAESISSVLKLLDKQIAAIDAHIDGHMDQHFKAQRQLLDTAKGMGPVTVLTLTAALPELGVAAGRILPSYRHRRADEDGLRALSRVKTHAISTPADTACALTSGRVVLRLPAHCASEKLIWVIVVRAFNDLHRSCKRAVGLHPP